MNTSVNTLGTLARLRPPFARSAALVFPFTREGHVSAGITVAMTAGEPALAAGDGVVARIFNDIPQWPTNDASLYRNSVQHVVIDHGDYVTTTVGGLSTTSVSLGQQVSRGDKLGDLFSQQLFVGATVGGRAVNPLVLNAHWSTQNSDVVAGQGGRIRFAPDRLVRDFSTGVAALLNAGIRYFSATPEALLVNIAFNGDGSKTGAGAVGALGDYWNVYTPIDFTAAISTACYVSGYYSFSDVPALHLNTSKGTRSSVILDRVAPLFSAAGTAGSWDDLLKAWVGGYVGPVPYENTFRLRNMPAGTYSLYLYADKGTFPNASTFYASVNVASPTALATNPTAVTSFIEGTNYVKYTLTVPAGGYITFKAVGYLAGVQLLRT